MSLLLLPIPVQAAVAVAAVAAVAVVVAVAVAVAVSVAANVAGMAVAKHYFALAVGLVFQQLPFQKGRKERRRIYTCFSAIITGAS